MTDPVTHEDRYAESSDTELIELYRHHHDLDAITVLIRRHDAALRVMARRVVRHDEDAADVVQSSWVHALTALARPEYEVHGVVRGWLWSIARNEAIDRLRRARVRPTKAMPPGLDVAARTDDYTAADARMVLAGLLDGLPTQYREAITLVWLRGLSIQETADVLAVPTGTVKSRCARARQLMASAVSRGGLITTALDPD
jgi:RNA polymerase sigma-70 factor, ECF subfamily